MTIELDNNNFYQYLNADHPVEGRYELISDINLSEFTPWEPVGNTSKPFSVTLNGNGHVISGLEVATSADNTTSGLFGSLRDSTIRQILLKQPEVISSGNTSPTGALVGALKDSRIEEVVNYAGAIRTGGYHSHAGGLAGSVSGSVIRNSVNTAAVFTTGSTSTGGIAGVADQSSSVSNNLNIGTITSRSLDNSPAGGIVGRLKGNGVANNNVNTGEVNAGHTEDSGGIVGKAGSARLLHNLNTGKIASDYLSVTSWKRAGSIGGIVGYTERQTLVSKNLNTGSTSGKHSTQVGGISGQSVNSSVVQNVNAGAVSSDGNLADIGGIAGVARGGSIHDNLNAGPVIGKGDDSRAGGMSSLARRASVYNNVNTGFINSTSHLSPAVANVYEADLIENNLDTFTKYYRVSTVDFNGYNAGVVRVSESALKSGLNGLSSRLWNAGDTTELPMLRGINTPYRELDRINGTQPTNNPFPTVLNEFADPGGAEDATSFNRTVWNGRHGYLPFPKVFSELQTLLAVMDCTLGGFDCSGVKDITATLLATALSSAKLSSAKPLTTELTTAAAIRALPDLESPSDTISATSSSLAQPLTRLLSTAAASSALPDSPSPTTHSLDLSNCQPPEGTPLFQTYDPENQRVYVVIQPESPSKGIVLARYKGSALDQQFGQCGIVTYTTSADYSRLLDSYPSLTGQVIHEKTGSHLVLVATTQSGKAILFEFPLSATRSYRGEFTVRNDLFPESVQINDTAYHQGAIYFTGTLDNSLLVGRYQQRRIFLSENSGSYDKEQGIHLKLSQDGKRLYVTGQSEEDAPDPLFIRQYDSQQLKPTASFGNNGRGIIATNYDDMINSQQDILIQKDQVFVALYSPEGKKLSIRRFASDNGQMDSAYMIDDSIDFPSPAPGSFATVRLIATEDYLHAVIYNSDGRLTVLTYKDQVNNHRLGTTFKPATANTMRPVFVGNKVYLAVEIDDTGEGNERVRMQEIALDLEGLEGLGNDNLQKPYDDLSPSQSSSDTSDWKTGLIIVGALVVVATVTVIVAIKKFKKQPLGSGAETHELMPIKANSA
ncbi:hypothetical protein [Endozoicomonas sp. ONNA1]|uniref:hypothetical protein n=1 Tax=Endozoicomonas sp. ONNA1 TaxID=2828740 RepID=UPI002149246B|nr:hypothetical protein [Endozoicomonas sp. ONNA1]